MTLSHGSRGLGLPAIALAALLLGACGGSSGSPSSGGDSPTPSRTALSLRTESVSGIGTVLANDASLTLYHNTEESGDRIV